MTSKLTRDRLAEIAQFGFSSAITPANDFEIKGLARMALAAMDSEPVAEVYQTPNVGICAALGPSIRMLCALEPGTKLYLHAQPAPVVPEEKLIPNTLSMYAVDAVAAIAEVKGWNACRAAMLQELKKSAGTEAICRSDENVQVLHTKSPAQSDCCPAQNDVAPAQSPIDHGYLPKCECSGCKATARICAELAGNSQVIPDGYVMVPKEPTEAMMLHNSGCQHHAWDDPDCAMRQTRRLIWSHMLAAAPQLPGSEPATVPGKWIPVSERMPEREVDVQVYCPDKKEQMVVYLERNELEGYFRFATWRTGDGIYCQPTHWMQLPAGPKEVKGE